MELKFNFGTRHFFNAVCWHRIVKENGMRSGLQDAIHWINLKRLSTVPHVVSTNLGVLPVARRSWGPRR